MEKFDVDFVWYRAPGYELAKRNTVIRAKGGPEPYSPRMESLPFIFERLDKPESYLQFARQYGLLKAGPVGGEEEIDYWRVSVGLVRGWIKVLAGNLMVTPSPSAGKLAAPLVATDIADAKVFIECHPDRPRRLSLRPASLLNAMLIKLATSGIASCEQCGRWYGAGGEGRRVVSRYCSDECRNRHNYEKRRKGK